MPDEDSFSAKGADNMNQPGGDNRRDRQPTERFSVHPALRPSSELVYAALPSHHSLGMSAADDGLVSTKSLLGLWRLFFLFPPDFATGGRPLVCRLRPPVPPSLFPCAFFFGAF